MLPLRQRAAHAARKVRPASLRTSRSYASDSHGAHGHAAPPVEESFGVAFYGALAAIPAIYVVYNISRPGKNGEEPALTSYLNSFRSWTKDWEQRNALHTAAIEQAAHDRHLFYNAGRNSHIDLRFPEVFSVGSPYNVPAGHYMNLDKISAHYKEKHLAEEERKAKKMAAQAQA